LGNATFNIQVYTGVSGNPLIPGSLIYSQPVPSSDINWNTWNDFELSTPLSIPINQELWTLLATDVFELTYTDTTLGNSTYEDYIYAVKSVYPNENLSEAAFSNVVSRVIIPNPPQELRYEIIQPNDVLLTWEYNIPSSNTKQIPLFIGYKVYRDTLQVSPLIEDKNFIDTNVNSGTYKYSVFVVYEHDVSEPAFIEVYVPPAEDIDKELLPIERALKGNYPNPFNPLTTIAFEISEESLVKIDIFNIRGQKVQTLVNMHSSSSMYINRQMEI